LESGQAQSLGAASHAVIHPGGGTVFVIRADSRGDPQIWSIDLHGTSESVRQHTYLVGGVGGLLSVSRDGRYLLANTENDGAPRLVLVTLDDEVRTF